MGSDLQSSALGGGGRTVVGEGGKLDSRILVKVLKRRKMRVGTLGRYRVF